MLRAAAVRSTGSTAAACLPTDEAGRDNATGRLIAIARAGLVCDSTAPPNRRPTMSITPVYTTSAIATRGNIDVALSVA
jgi:hypothetical protein